MKRTIYCVVVVSLVAVSASVDVVADAALKQEWNFLSAVLVDGALKLVEGRQHRAVAWASFRDSTLDEGWSYLQVRTNPKYADNVTAYAAGALEAALTRDLMKNQYDNLYKDYCKGRTEFCQRVETYIQEQTDYLYEQSSQLKGVSPFWNQVHLMLQQLTGLDDQYEGQPLDPSHRYKYTVGKASMFYNWEGDMLDLENALKRTPNEYSLNQVGRCSALVKIVHNDIYFSHVSWFTYKAMIRIQKRYMFAFRETASLDAARIIGHTVGMSSYPGKLVSLDDFYLLSSGLAVTETTNDNANDELWKKISPKSVPTWIRAMAANRISRSPKHWADNFQQENSGTYNNQWMILDYNRFRTNVDGGRLFDGAFWVVEQMPTLFRSQDLTKLLVGQGFWSSYNIPYFDDIYNISGMYPLYEKYGNYYSHDHCPRATIFRRDQGKISNITQMISMMRYNDYKNDPASRCNCTPPYNPTYAISSRYDLVDPNGHYDIPRVAHKAVGGIDVKVTDLKRFKQKRFVAINGPTHDQQPIFSWSQSGFNIRPIGHPDSFNFGPVDRRWPPL